MESKSDLLKIAVCQIDILWEEKSKNLDRYSLLLERVFKEQPDTTLIVFPEFFTTGFSFNEKMCEYPDKEESVMWMRDASKKFGAAIIATVPYKDGEKYKNRAFFISQEVEDYNDKRHIFKYGGESKQFDSSDDLKIINYNGWNFCLLVCYDLRFPVWSRNVDLKYDVLIYPSNWPSSRIGVTEPLVKARGIENLCYSIFVNRTGSDPNIYYSGGSIVSDYSGKLLLKLGIEEQIGYAAISKVRLDDYRKKYRFFEDSDKFKIEQI